MIMIINYPEAEDHASRIHDLEALNLQLCTEEIPT